MYVRPIELANVCALFASQNTGRLPPELLISLMNRWRLDFYRSNQDFIILRRKVKKPQMMAHIAAMSVIISHTTIESDNPLLIIHP